MKYLKNFKLFLAVNIFVALIIGTYWYLSSSSPASAVGGYPDYTPPAGSPLANKQHPRLFFTSSDLPEIASRIKNYYASEWQSFVNTMDGLYSTSPASKTTYDLYFDTRNYAFLCAIRNYDTGASFAYSQSQYCQQAVDHALTISDTCSDERHDFAEWWRKGGCKMSAAIAYDWTYNYISDGQRQQLANKLLALYDNEADRDIFAPYKSDTTPFISNQHITHLHAVIFPALALWGDPYVASDKAQTMLDHMADAWLTRVLDISNTLFGPDRDSGYNSLFSSAQPEGTAYGHSIFPALMYPLQATVTALGEDYFSTLPFAREVPLFYYYKMKPFAVDGNFYYAAHDTGAPGDVIYQVGCTNKCEHVIPRLWRGWAFYQRKSQPNLAGLWAWLASQSPVKVDPANYKYADGVRHYGLFNMFLGGERGISAKTPSQANLPLFKRIGDWTVFKSSHDFTSSTYLEVDSPIWYYAAAHNKWAPSGLQLSKFGTLIVKSGNTKNGPYCPRVKGTDQPAFGSITGPYRDDNMSLALQTVRTGDQENSNEITEGSVNDVGDIEIFDSFSGVDVFGYNYTRVYAKDSSVNEARQQVVYLRGSSDTSNDEFIVEFNRIVSTYSNKKILHLTAEPQQISSNIFAVTNTYGGSHGKVYITTVEPTGVEKVIEGGGGKEWLYADGSSAYSSALSDQCRNLSGYYTLYLNSPQSNFVTVYQPGDANTLTSPTTVTKLSATGMSGVQVGNKVVLFNSAPAQPLDSTGYTVSASGALTHILVGFAPNNSYQVDVNGSKQTVTASQGGVLYFTDNASGQRTISVGGGTPPPADTTAPTVDSFDVQPRTTENSVTVSWQATDDQSLNRVEVWRAPDNQGQAGNWSKIHTTYVSGTSHSGSYVDTPAEGSWWYGVHAVDQAGNVGYEPAPISITKTAPANQPPQAQISATPTAGILPLTVQFSASGSTDSDGTIVSYDWDFGDGQSGSGEVISHTYQSAGNFTAILTVTDDKGAIDTDSVVIAVSASGSESGNGSGNDQGNGGSGSGTGSDSGNQGGSGSSGNSGSTGGSGSSGGGGSGKQSPPVNKPDLTSLLPTEIFIKVVEKKYVQIDWRPSSSPDFAYLNIYRSQVAGQLGKLIFSQVVNGPVVDRGVEIGQRYFYTLRAVNKSGQESDNIYKGSGIEISADAKVNVDTEERERQISRIKEEAREIIEKRLDVLLQKIGKRRNNEAENKAREVYLQKIKANKLSLDDQERVVLFIAYGTTDALRLGEGERAGVLNSFQSAFGKLPQTEIDWEDVIKISTGRWPAQTSAIAEERAKKLFVQIYLRSPDMNNPHDNAAVTIMAYGLRPAQRNLNSEAAAIRIFRNIFGRVPSSAVDWDVVRAIAYSGAQR